MSKQETTDNGCQRCSERLIGVVRTAEILGISPKSIRNRMSAGQFAIKHYKYGGRVLFKLSEITEFINNLT